MGLERSLLKSRLSAHPKIKLSISDVFYLGMNTLIYLPTSGTGKLFSPLTSQSFAVRPSQSLFSHCLFAKYSFWYTINGEKFAKMDRLAVAYLDDQLRVEMA